MAAAAAAAAAAVRASLVPPWCHLCHHAPAGCLAHLHSHRSIDAFAILSQHHCSIVPLAPFGMADYDGGERFDLRVS